jgi:hypothetical protein
MSMIFYIFLYGFTRYLIPNGSDKISIFPKLPTPQFSLYLWISQKDLLCTNAFENSHHLTNRISGWYRCKYMDMIFRYFHFLNFTVSCFQYLFKELLNRISQLFFQYPLAIFGCPHKMVSCVVHCMAHSFDGHAGYYTTSLKKGNPFLPVLPHGVSRVSFS